VKVRFLGGARTVTGSMHLVETVRSRVLLECGMFHGHRAEADAINRNPAPEAVQADFAILSHSHVDHSGNIPTLVKRGFARQIYQTPASLDLTGLLLRDSGHIQESDIRYVNRKRARAGQEPKEPLYTAADVEAALKFLSSLPYDQPLTSGDVTFRLLDAGHILGSAGVELAADGQVLMFSGDLGRPNLPLIRDPIQPLNADFLIIESTYGNRLHPEFASAADELADVIRRVAGRGGRVIIPAFALERTQEIVFCLFKLLRDRRVPELPVFVDSPLASSITDVFRRHPSALDAEMLELFRGGQDPFRFAGLRYIDSPAESMRLNHLRQSCIIISTSGMCENGRILHHLKRAVPDERNAVVIVGFAAEHTLARRLVERQPRVRIFGEEYERRAEVATIDAFSAHADRNGLLDYVRRFDRSRLKRVFLVHGELSQSEALQARLQAEGYDAVIPEKGQEFELA
jgi:metallo-beta-lactamase family protein